MLHKINIYKFICQINFFKKRKKITIWEKVGTFKQRMMISKLDQTQIMQLN